jgi:hypothetical protein
VAPWIGRQLAVFGQVSPSSASGKVFFIRSIEEWNSISTPATLDWLLGQGIGPLVASRVGGLVAAAGIFTTLACAGLLVVPLVIGAWSRRRSIDFAPFFIYAGLLFGFSGLVSAVHVPGGTFIHSAVALVPHAYILVLEGVAVGVAWISARRRRWDREAATRVFTGAAVAFGAIAALTVAFGVHGGWEQKRSERQALAAALTLAGATPDSRVMAIDAAGMNYAGGFGGVVSPNDPIDTIESVARAYRIEWLVLERDGIVPALGPVLAGESRPAWIGPAVYTIPASDGGTPRAAVYPICQGPADVRCTVVALAGGAS